VKDVETDQIKRTEGRRLRTTDRRARHLVDFFDRVTVLEHRLDRKQRAEGADPIGDEVRTIFRGHDAFAETLIEKAVEEARDRQAWTIRYE
jgi:hypothetical protein